MPSFACRPAVAFLLLCVGARVDAAPRAHPIAAPSSPTASAPGTPAPGGASVPDLVAAAQRDNPSLQAARVAIDVSRARLANTGLKPNPRLELGARSDRPFGNEGEYELSAAVSQDFPVAGRLLRARDVARVDVAIAQAEVDEAARKLAGDVASAAWRLRVLDRRIEDANRPVAVDEALLAVLRKRLRAAEVSEMDINTVRIELQRHAQAVLALEAERKATAAGLDALLGRPVDAPLRVAGEAGLPPLPPLATLQAQARAQRPDWHKALLGIDRAAAEVALARSERWEDWSVALGVSQDRQVIRGAPPQDPGRMVGASLSIPLPLRNNGAARMALSSAEAQQAQAQADAQGRAIDAEVAVAYARVEALRAGLLQSGDFAPAERNLQLARLGYSMAMLSVMDVVRAQRELAETRTRYFELLDQALQAQVQLQTATGALLRGDAPAPPRKDR